MIHLNFSITNPWGGKFRSFKSWTGRTPWADRFWEFQIYRTADIVGVTAEITTRRDHAGVVLSLALFSYNLEFSVYSTDHFSE